MGWKCCPWWTWIYCMCSTFHEFIWLSTRCYTHSEEEDVGSAGDRGRSHEAMSIDKGKGRDPTEHSGHPESIASNKHASPLPSDKADSQNNREDITGLFAKLKELEAEILKLQNRGPHIQVCKPSLVPDANRRQRGSREKSTNLFHVRDTSLTLFDTKKVDHWT